mgnify:CR=1 FL=1
MHERAVLIFRAAVVLWVHMKIDFKGLYRYRHELLMRQCGYGMIQNRRTGEISFARRLSNGLYPRFHAYVDTRADGFTVNLHLDQKAPSYGNETAHSGEYDGQVVEAEGERLRRVIEALKWT